MLFDMDYTYMNSHVAKILRSTINISLGHSYSHGRGDSDEFVSLLEELLAGSACGAKRSEQQEWAFFILRHTERTADGNSIVVEDELKYWLMEMSTIPSLWKKWHKLMRPMLLANGLRLP